MPACSACRPAGQWFVYANPDARNVKRVSSHRTIGNIMNMFLRTKLFMALQSHDLDLLGPSCETCVSARSPWTHM
eukprot:9241856-Alexandrium_andersonii.AAC.1